VQRHTHKETVLDLLDDYPPVSRGRYIYDLETNGLLEAVSKVHCAVIFDLDTRELIGFRPHEIGKFLELYQKATLLIGHNIIGYDAQVILKLYGITPNANCVQIDTLSLARLIFSDVKQQDFKWAKAWKAYRQKCEWWLADEKARVADQWGEDTAESWDYGEPPFKAPKEFPGQFCGAHSLEAWGYRLGEEKKGDYSKEMKAKGLDPWESFNEAMYEYMLQDARVNRVLYEHLCDQPGYSEQAVLLEMACQDLVCRMERNGWPFNREAAEDLLQRLTQRRYELNRQLQEAFPPLDVRLPDFIPKRSNRTKGWVAGVPVEKWETITFNPASRDHIAERLTRKYQWEPKEYTDAGSPKLDDDVLKALPYPEAAALAEYFMIQKRIGQLAEGAQAWLRSVSKKGKIHGRYNSNGAVTGRATHSSPNIGQVPGVASEYGWDCRALFTVLPGWTQLGADQSGLELRCLGSYLSVFDGGEYRKIVLYGDVHWENAKALFGLPAGTIRDEENHPEHKVYRNAAKTFIYAFLYGSGPENLGALIGVSKEERRAWLKCPKHLAALKKIQATALARKKPVPTGMALAHIYKGMLLTDAFLDAMPAFKKLLKVVKKAAKKGYLKGLDGRHIPVRSEHAALNSLLQGAGAIICKSWITLAEQRLIAAGFKPSQGINQEWAKDADFVFMGWVHDEIQVAVRNPDHVAEISRIIIQAGREAGDCFKSWDCPLDVDVKVGTDWATCH
jgi:DNA polymerase I